MSGGRKKPKLAPRSPGSSLPQTLPGAEAQLLGAPAPEEGLPSTSTVNPHGKAAPSWEDQHKRVTFHCPISLLERVEAEMRQSGRSKSRVIVDALEDALRLG